jgi:hypothetical protein
VVNNFGSRPLAQIWIEPAQNQPPRQALRRLPRARRIIPLGRAWRPCARASSPWTPHVLLSAMCPCLPRRGGAPKWPARAPSFSSLASPPHSHSLRTRAQSAATPLPSRAGLRQPLLFPLSRPSSLPMSTTSSFAPWCRARSIPSQPLLVIVACGHRCRDRRGRRCVWPGGHEPSPVKLQPPLSSRGPLGAPPLHHHRRRAFPSSQSASVGAPVTGSARFHGQPALGHLARSRVIPRRRRDLLVLMPPLATAAGDPLAGAASHRASPLLCRRHEEEEGRFPPSVSLFVWQAGPAERWVQHVG